MGKWTPGPWEVRDGSTGSNFSKGWRTIVAPSRRVVDAGAYESNVNGTVFGVAISEADANLIAVAPELHEALEHIAEYWNRDQNETAMADALWHIIETAEAALKKVRGE